MSALHDAARDYARRGWPVFPCVPRGKVPLIARERGGRGLHDATTDLGAIDQWWRDCPQANIGLRTGVMFDVVDVDSHDGLMALCDLQAGRPMPWGPEVRTGSGGIHLFHRPLEGAGNRAGIVPGVDYRGANGYVIAPPSIHPSGGAYAWCELARPDEPLEPLPGWLAELVLPPRPAASAALPRFDDSRGDRYGEKALADEVARVLLARVGERNDALNRAGFALGQLVGAGMLDLERVVSALIGAGRQAGLDEHEIEGTLRSGVGAGVRQPRKAAS